MLLSVVLLATPVQAQVKCGDWVNKSLTLTSDLSCGSSPALRIGGDNVILDCNGYTIRGNASGNQVGVEYYSVSNLTITSCIFENFTYGISGAGFSGAHRINQLLLVNNTFRELFAVDLSGANLKIVHNIFPTLNLDYTEDVTVSENKFGGEAFGSRWSSGGITAENSINFSITNNWMNNSYIQIRSLYVDVHGMIKDNTILETNYGINLVGGLGITIKNNYIQMGSLYSGPSSISLQSTNNNTIFNNTINITNPRGMGIVVSSIDNKIWRNTFYGRGIKDSAYQQMNNYCIGVGNRYFKGAGKNRPPGDCGPLPNVDTFTINPIYKDEITFNESATGTFQYRSPADAIGNGNYFIPQKYIIEKGSGPYKENIIISNLPNTVLNCEGNTLQGASGTSFSRGIEIFENYNITVSNCILKGYSLGIDIRESNGDLIEKNVILTNKGGRGISFYNTENFTFQHNYIESYNTGIVLSSPANNNIIFNNTINSTQLGGGGIDIYGQNNTIWRNTLYQGGIYQPQTSVNSYCVNVGNRYLDGAEEFRAPGDCGPFPNVHTFMINPKYPNPVIEFNTRLKDTLRVNSPKIISNANYFANKQLIFEPNTGPYDIEVVLSNLPNTTIECNGNVLEKNQSLKGFYIRNSVDVRIRNCIINKFSYPNFLGIHTSYSQIIMENNIFNDTYIGITGDNKSIFRDNIFHLSAFHFQHDENSILVNNTFFNSKLFSFRRSKYGLIENNNIYGSWLSLISTKYFIIKDNYLENTGLSLSYDRNSGSSSNNQIYNNIFNTTSVNLGGGIFISQSYRNKVWRNTLIRKGITDSPYDMNTFCDGVGNLYLKGASEKRGPGDCGPMPNIDSISIDPSYPEPVIDFNTSVTGEFKARSPSQAIGVANTLKKQAITMNPNTGPYKNIILNNFANKTFDCNGNLLNESRSGIGIEIEYGNKIIIRNCRITNFYWGNGIQSFNSNNIVFDGNTISNANIGIKIGESVFIPGGKNYSIANNTIQFNKIGIDLAEAINVTITLNNIVNSSTYSVRNAQRHFVNAERNWWGTTNSSKINDLILDFRDKPWYGIVDYIPFLTSPISSSFQIVTGGVPNAQVGKFYSFTFEALGGSPPYKWTVKKGNLPSGILLQQNGELKGTPTEAGNFTFTARVTDSRNRFVERSFTLEVLVTLPTPKLRIHKWGTAAVPGRVLDYFIILENLEDKAVSDIGVMELLNPLHFNFTSSNPPPELVDTNGSAEVVFWRIPVIRARDIERVTYKARLNRNVVGTNVTGPVCADLQLALREKWKERCDPFLNPNSFGKFSLGTDSIRLNGSYCSFRNSPARGNKHLGYDYCADTNTVVRAEYSGKVVAIVDWGFNTKAVWIESTIGVKTFVVSYGHLTSSVSVNQPVKKGDEIGKILPLPSSANTNCGTKKGHLDVKMFWWPLSGSQKWYDRAFDFNNFEDGKKTECPNNNRGTKAHERFKKCMKENAPTCDEHIQPIQRPKDPNEKGVIANKFIQPEQKLPYVIHYENIGNTSAKDIFLTDIFNKEFNTTSVEVFVNNTFKPLAEGQSRVLFEKNITRTINKTIGNKTFQFNISYIEKWTVSLNKKRTLFWNFSNIFLKPNATDNVLFSIKPLAGLPSGTALRNKAKIQFEIFETITTNETLNIIDDIKPNCTMKPLPIETRTPNFTISWKGSDKVGEIDFYTILTAVDGGSFTEFINKTTDTNTTFTGVSGRKYAFICIATDTAGNTEVRGPGAEAVTFVNRATIAVKGEFKLGKQGQFIIHDPDLAGQQYLFLMGITGTSPGIPLGDGRFVPVNYDAIVEIVLLAPTLIGLVNAQGVLDSSGKATITWNVPNISFLPLITFDASCVTINATQPIPQAIKSICTPSVTIRIKP